MTELASPVKTHEIFLEHYRSHIEHYKETADKRFLTVSRALCELAQDIFTPNAYKDFVEKSHGIDKEINVSCADIDE